MTLWCNVRALHAFKTFLYIKANCGRCGKLPFLPARLLQTEYFLSFWLPKIVPFLPKFSKWNNSLLMIQTPFWEENKRRFWYVSIDIWTQLPPLKTLPNLFVIFTPSLKYPQRMYIWIHVYCWPSSPIFCPNTKIPVIKTHFIWLKIITEEGKHFHGVLHYLK